MYTVDIMSIYTYAHVNIDNYPVGSFLRYLTLSGTNSSVVWEVKKPAGDKMCRRPGVRRSLHFRILK